jgi:hypothetical protein
MARSYKPLPSSEDLWELFSLDPFAGTLYWRTHTQRRLINKPFGSRYNNGYIVGEIKEVRHAAHRLIWKWVHNQEPLEIDHKDHIRHNNAPWNLRSVTRTANHCNRNNVKGYTKTPSGKYKATVALHGTQYYLGHYSTPEEARAAYDSAAAALHGGLINEKQAATVQDLPRKRDYGTPGEQRRERLQQLLTQHLQREIWGL